MQALKARLAQQRQQAADEGTAGKVLSQAQIEELRLKRLREEEQRELEAKVCTACDAVEQQPLTARSSRVCACYRSRKSGRKRARRRRRLGGTARWVHRHPC